MAKKGGGVEVANIQVRVKCRSDKSDNVQTIRVKISFGR